MIRWLQCMSGLCVVALLTACAGMPSVRSEVATYNQWPAGLAAGRYAFERLPSQQAQAAEQTRLEDLARPALAAAGFKRASEGQRPEFTVQLGVRASRADRSPYDDPLWWRGGIFVSRGGRHTVWGPSLSLHLESPRYEREVVLLIRDAATGQPLYEARAANEGNSFHDEALLAAMFRAAMSNFPHSGPSPRQVTVPWPEAAP
jgi:hypothetical protein